jgi:hypothetical protein
VNRGTQAASPLSRLVALVLIFLPLLPVYASAQASSWGDAFWPKLALRYQWPSRISQDFYTQFKNEGEIAYQQLGVGTDLNYEVKRIAQHRLIDFDPSKEHAFQFGIGYQYLTTVQSGVQSDENRLKAVGTIRHRPVPALLLEDRNQFEFRWVDGVYSSRYRNRVTAQDNITRGSLTFSPYLSAEFFYSWSKEAWNQQRYSAGIQWPHRGHWRLDAYYLLKVCDTCDPQHLNVLGLSFTRYLGTSTRGVAGPGSPGGSPSGK